MVPREAKATPRLSIAMATGCKPTEAHLDLRWTLGNLCTTPGSDVYFSRESTGFNDYTRTSIIMESLYMLFIFMI